MISYIGKFFDPCNIYYITDSKQEMVRWRPKGPRVSLATLRDDLAHRFAIRWHEASDRLVAFGTLPGGGVILVQQEGQPPRIMTAGTRQAPLRKIAVYMERTLGFEPFPLKVYAR